MPFECVDISDFVPPVVVLVVADFEPRVDPNVVVDNTQRHLKVPRSRPWVLVVEEDAQARAGVLGADADSPSGSDSAASNSWTTTSP